MVTRDDLESFLIRMDLDYEELPEEGTTLILHEGEQVGEYYQEDDGTWIGSVTGELDGQPFSVTSAPCSNKHRALALVVKTLNRVTV